MPSKRMAFPPTPPHVPLSNLLHERFAQALHRRLFAGETQSDARTGAYHEAGFQSADSCALHNARRLANTADVKARLAWLADAAAARAVLDSTWVLLQYKAIAESNLDDFLTPPNESGERFIDLGSVPREKLAHLVELHQEEVTEFRGPEKLPAIVRKVKIKREDRLAALLGIRQMLGFDAPKKVAVTDKAGDDVTLEGLVLASFAVAAEVAGGQNGDEKATGEGEFA